jgi:phosphinothricin acetyltransferase
LTRLSIRDASEGDLAAIFAIYNEAILSSTATWDLEQVAALEQLAWLREHQAPYAAVVAGEGDAIYGWGSLSRYRAKEGYRFSVEDTIYVRPDRLRQGVGRALLSHLVDRARAGGFRTVLAKISAENEASIKLHKAMGFFEAGREQQVGFKFGRWLDLVTMQLLLDD